ncbi:MAG: YbaN family protein [Fimbriimonadales bacterium]|nr:YbaN family protein [Fimbriimonadales bacterium]
MRPIYFASGVLLVSIGVIGAFVPLLPTTIFMILALWCFSKSSPKAENWLLEHPRFGKTLRAWRKDGSISAKHKVIAITMIWVSIGMTAVFLVSMWWVRVVLAVTAVSLTVYLLSRPTRIDATSSTVDRLAA